MALLHRLLSVLCNVAATASVGRVALPSLASPFLKEDNTVGRVGALEAELGLELELLPPQQPLRESMHERSMARLDLNAMRRIFPSNRQSYLLCSSPLPALPASSTPAATSSSAAAAAAADAASDTVDGSDVLRRLRLLEATASGSYARGRGTGSSSKTRGSSSGSGSCSEVSSHRPSSAHVGWRGGLRDHTSPACAGGSDGPAAPQRRRLGGASAALQEKQARANKEREEAIAAIDSIPMCPEFAPCTVHQPRPLPPSYAAEHPEIYKIANLVPDAGPGSVALCGTELGRDLPEKMFGEPPENCPKLPGHPVVRAEGSGDPTDGLDPRCSAKQDFGVVNPIGHDVARLRRVYVNGDELVFNRSTIFLRQGCKDGKQRHEPLAYMAGSRNVVHVAMAFNLAYGLAGNFYFTFIEVMPSLMQLAHFLRVDPHLPVLVFKHQLKRIAPIVEPLLGVSLLGLRRYEMAAGSTVSGSLVHVDTLYQPILPICGTPGRHLWQHMRRNHLLPRDGLPIFNPDWTLRRPHAKPLSAAAMAAYPDDWVVVVARRQGTRRILRQMPQIMAELERIFPPERIVTFWGNLTILEARELFGRARLFVAGHGAGESNVVFMPANSTLFEIRPRMTIVACYKFLAEASGVRYRLLIAEGPDTGTYDVDLDDAIAEISSIAKLLT